MIALLLAPLLLAPQARETRDWDWRLTDRGVEFSPLEGVDLRLGGRIHYDIAQFDPDQTPIADESGYRRLRWRFSGNLPENLSFYVERDVGGTTIGWKDAWLRYRAFDGLEITAGNQVAPFSLDAVTASDDTLFLERALPTALAAGLYRGVAARGYGEHWTSSIGYFGNPLDSQPKKRSSGHGVVARTTVAPIVDDDRLVHLGASVEYRDVDFGSRYRIRPRPEVRITDVRLIDTRNINDVQRTTTYGLEAAATLGPFSAQAEYIQSALDRQSIDVRFAGWYAQAAYVLTGQHHAYNDRLGRLRPIETESRWGALEAGVRWSNLSLQDKNLFGGEESDLTLGLNWYVNANVKVMTNYIFIHADPNQFGIVEDPEAFVVRLVVSF